MLPVKRMPETKPYVEVKFLSTFFTLCKKENLNVPVPDKADLNYLVDVIEEKLGNEVAAHIRDHLDYVVLAVNNVDCKQMQGLKTPLKNGDRVVIGHVIAGG
jgi:molybdopterin converting factor small subunit